MIHIRATRPEDLEGLRQLHANACDTSIYFRFFTVNRASAQDYAATLARPNDARHHALVACIRDRIVAVASFERIDDTSAEFALIVADDAQHEGIGTLLLEHLASVARHAGITRFVADVLAQNHAMIVVLHDLGFTTTARSDGGTIHYELPLDPSSDTVAAIGAREHAADVASLRPLLRPRSIAVIGASEREGSVGHQVLANLLNRGFTGSIHVVNPRHPAVLGVPAVPSPLDLPEAPDLAIIAVPAPSVPDIVEQCGVRGARAILLLTAGFGELGAAGKQLQDDTAATAREYGMRLVGPNCVGVVNTDPAIRLDATFAAMPIQPGGLGILSQSGAFGIGLVEAAARSGTGISQFVSVGNKADVSGNDILLYWEDDPTTRVIAMYLESIADARRFARIARRVSATKPILAVKSGRSDAGRRAGQSHTAAAASAEVAVDALFAKAGVLRMDSVQQMLDVARVLNDQPLPGGPCVTIIGNSGGPGIVAADAASAAGLIVTDLDQKTQDELRKAVPSIASAQNPIDLGAAVTPEQVEKAMQIVLGSGRTDAVLAVFTQVAVTHYDQIRAALVRVAAGAHKTVVAVDVGAPDISVPMPGTDRALPTFTFPEPAAIALGLAHRYAAHREAEPRGAPALPVDRAAAERIVRTAAALGDEWLRPDLVADLLTAYGITTCPQRLVVDVDAAIAAAEIFGYPVVLKLGGGSVHKSEVGGVRVGRGDPASLRGAFAELRAVAADPSAPLLVQAMVSGGAEAIVGAVRDPNFGALVMVGSGGVTADISADRSFLLAPVTEAEAALAVDGLRLARILDGFRGSEPLSRSALTTIVTRVAALVDDLPEIAELDLNPVICRRADVLVVDARIRIETPGLQVDPYTRQLRSIRQEST